MRVFLDADVVVSAFATRGLCADVLRDVLTRHVLVASADLFREVDRALREKLRAPDDIAAEAVSLLREIAVVVEPSGEAGLPIPDPADRILVAAALEGGADLFVTGDRELLALGRAGGRTDIVAPRTFWERVKGPVRP